VSKSFDITATKIEDASDLPLVLTVCKVCMGEHFPRQTKNSFFEFSKRGPKTKSFAARAASRGGGALKNTAPPAKEHSTIEQRKGKDCAVDAGRYRDTRLIRRRTGELVAGLLSTRLAPLHVARLLSACLLVPRRMVATIVGVTLGFTFACELVGALEHFGNAAS
jgi:hypothetical protein